MGDLIRHGLSDARDDCSKQLLALAENDESEEIRCSALLALADGHMTEGLPLAIRSCHGTPPQVQQSALIAVGELAGRGDPPAVQALVRALRSASSRLRFQAFVAGVRVFELQELVPLIVEQLTSSDAEFRDLACRAAEERIFLDSDVEVSPAVLKGVRQLLRDPNPRVQTVAAIALARGGDGLAAHKLVEAINGKGRFSEAADEQAAVELCGELGLNDATLGLRRRLRRPLFSGRPGFEYSARVALAQLGDGVAIQQIMGGLKASSRWKRTRSAAAAGAARLQGARARLIALRDTDPRVDQATVVQALEALNGGKQRL